MAAPIDPQSRIKELETKLKKAKLDLDTTKRELGAAVAAGKEKDTKISQLQSEVATLVQKNIDLEKALDDIKKVRPKMKVEDVARQLSKELETLRSEAQQKSTEGTPSVMVDQIEVEIKGGIDLKDGVHLTQLLAQEVSPQTVSTVKFVLRPMPVIKIVDEST